MDTKEDTATLDANSVNEQDKPPDIQSPLLKSAVDDWDVLNNEFKQLQVDHDLYKKKLDEMKILQKKCLSGIAHQRYRIKKISESLMLESYAGRSRNLDELDQSLVGDLTVVEAHLLKSQDFMRVRGKMLNLDKYQVDWVCKHLGHIKSVHKAHYQQMSDFIERVHIAKLLLVQDMNLTKQFKGKKLEDIDVSEIVFPEETTAVQSGKSEVLAESVSKAFLELERGVPDPITTDKGHIRELKTKMTKRKNAFRDLEDNLPHKNGLYLSIILGQVNISLLNKEDKYLYKQNYEKFKLTLSYIIFALSLFLVGSNYIISSTTGVRWMDAVLHFLLVWYYCTLTIREQILIVNGSRIKGWWLVHHFVSTACSGITLIWPDGWSYWQFRTQYGWFIFYVAFVQVLQYYYQKGCLYRLKALGQRHDMDITVEGFMSWMFKGLAFLLPFLIVAYLSQLYNAIVLYRLYLEPRCTEWQVPVLSVIHLVLFLGNMTTLLGVLKTKFTKDIQDIKKVYKNKYRFNSKPKTM